MDGWVDGEINKKYLKICGDMIYNKYMNRYALHVHAYICIHTIACVYIYMHIFMHTVY